MRRLTYTPKTYVFVKDRSGKIHDLSEYVTGGSVSRKVDQVSSATVTLRNPHMIFTAKIEDGKNGKTVRKPTFSPMDPITIFLERAPGKPVRVFTGFLDTVPYLQLFPGVIELKASCTLKRLLYTWFDPALPYTQDFLKVYGWMNNNGMVTSPDAFNEFKQESNGDFRSAPRKKGEVDGSFANLLYATLKHIARWDEDSVYIEALQPAVFERLVALSAEFIKNNETAKSKMEELYSRLAGGSSYGSASGAGGDSRTITTKGVPSDLIPIYQDAAAKYKLGERGWAYLAAINRIETDFGRNLSQSSAGAVGWMQFMPTTWDSYGVDATGDGKKDPNNKKDAIYAAAKYLKASGAPGNWHDAIYAYNHAEWYVDDVTSHAEDYLKNQTASPDPDGATKQQKAREKANPTAVVTGPSVYEHGDGNTKQQKAREKANPTAVVTGPSVYEHGDGNTDQTERATRSKGSTKNTDVSDGTTTGMATGITGSSVANVPGQEYGASRDYPGGHAGVDISMPFGTELVALCDGIIRASQTTGWYDKNPTGAGLITIESTGPVGGYPKGTMFGYGHASQTFVNIDQKVTAGKRIGLSGLKTGSHLHFFINTAGNAFGNGNTDPTALAKALLDGTQLPATGGTDSGTGGPAVDGDPNGLGPVFFGGFEFASLADSAEATLLGGQKSLMNDKPLLPFIQQLCNASLRHFQSLPDGRFYAFFPDYFGEMKAHPPYWLIDDIEILDGKIELTDDALVTHMYVVGDTTRVLTGGGQEAFNSVNSSGVVTLYNVFLADSVLNRTQARKGNLSKAEKARAKDDEKWENLDPATMGFLLDAKEVTDFLQRYGARPVREDMPMIRSPYYEMFLAYQKFLLGWSRQFATEFTFTFMPELFPGGKVGFPNHSLQMYIEEVQHTWDYESGFLTSATLSAPSVWVDKSNKSAVQLLPENMAKAITEPIRKASVTPERAPGAGH